MVLYIVVIFSYSYDSPFNLVNIIGRNYFFSSKEKIPTLKEVLKLIQGKVLIDIELKKTKNIEKLCNKVLEEVRNYTGDVLLKSFQPNIVRYLKKHTTRPVGLLITRIPTSKTYSYFMSSPLLIQYCKPDFLAMNKEIIKKKQTSFLIDVLILLLPLTNPCICSYEVENYK